MDAPQTQAPSLSEKLEKSDGIIRPPPAIDPGILAPTPPTGDTEMVVPPPMRPDGAPATPK